MELIGIGELAVEQAVRDRYSQAAQKRETALCCATSLKHSALLDVLPDEIVERDYGCGDPSQHVEAGEVVLDLGSGSGKACYVAAQLVGAAGRVIGVDMNDEMLALARKYQASIAEKIGYSNVEFRRGRIQDLGTDLDVVDAMLAKTSLKTAADYLAFEEQRKLMAQSSPMIADNSVDVVLSNCVLNLVAEGDRHQLLAELFRVLKPGGRAVISDIVSSAVVPEHLKKDADLWSGCISGAFEERAFYKAFEQAGFIAIEAIERQQQPWQTVESIEFRSVTIRAYKPPVAMSTGALAYVTYRGPWRSAMTDDSVLLNRGEPMLVPLELAERWSTGPMKSQLTVQPYLYAGQVAEGHEQCCGAGASKCC